MVAPLAEQDAPVMPPELPPPDELLDELLDEVEEALDDVPLDRLPAGIHAVAGLHWVPDQRLDLQDLALPGREAERVPAGGFPWPARNALR